MESYQKIFADDLNSGRSDLRHAIVQTVSGRRITKCCFCGALTEIPDSQKPVLTLTIYDPTGILTARCHTGNKEISAFLTDTTLPVFVLCTAGIQCSAGTCIPTLESIVSVSRAVRDGFVLAATDDLIGRMAASPNVAPDLKNKVCRMAEKAISTVRTETPKPPVPEEAVLNQVGNLILKCCEDKTAVHLDSLVETLSTKGIPREIILAELQTLINNGDCYQPKPDKIKRL